MAVYIWPPQSVTTLPPVGGASAANQLIEIQELQDINTDTSDIADSVASIDVKTPALVGGKVPVDTGLTPGLTDAELRATPVPISGTVTTNAGTNLNTSALSLEATQLLVKAAIDLINGKTPALGQALDAASVPVVLTAAQIATLTPPAAITGFATASRQDLQTASLTSIDGKLAGTLTVTQAVPTVTQTDDTQNTDSITPVAFTKPAGAKNMVIFNNAGASVANRIRFGAAPSFASSGTGALLGVGSSTALLPASTISVIAENTDSNANVTVLWFY